MPTAKDPDVVVEINIKQSPAAATPRPPVVRPPAAASGTTFSGQSSSCSLQCSCGSQPVAIHSRKVSRNLPGTGTTRLSWIAPFRFRRKISATTNSTCRKRPPMWPSWEISPCCRTLQVERTTVSAHPRSPTMPSRSTFSASPLSPSGRPGMPRVRCLRAAESRKARSQADLPPGSGVYYLVFNNKFSPSTGEEGRRHRGAALQELDSGMDPATERGVTFVDLQLTLPT